MCKAPTRLADGTEVACRECSLCRDRKINDWVGRNIAESKTAKAAHAITLTYGRNKVGEVLHERAVILTYSDVQKYFKLLRRHGYPVRYFVTGEFGSEKGRAHWHVMAYWLDKVPPHIPDMRVPQEHWPHGTSFWTAPTAQAIRYNCKYIQKDMGEAERQGHLAMSKKPPLGARYFEQLAERYVQQGLAPQDLHYSFPEVRRKKRKGGEQVIPFLLRGRSAELFLEHYVKTWRETYPGQHVPNSELVEEFMDTGAWQDREADREFVMPEQRHRPYVHFDEIDFEREMERRYGS